MWIYISLVDRVFKCSVSLVIFCSAVPSVLKPLTITADLPVPPFIFQLIPIFLLGASDNRVGQNQNHL